MIVGHIGGGSVGVDTGDIPASLRFRGAAPGYGSRTFGTPTTQNTFTFFAWMKRGKLATQSMIFGESGGNSYGLAFNANDTIALYINSAVAFSSTAVFRDPTAWVPILWSQSGTTQTIYRGNEIVASGTATNARINSAIAHYLMSQSAGSIPTDGYLSRVCFIDGQALTPTSFIQFNTEINEWVSKSQSAVKAVVDAGGANSFMLDFDDGTSLTTLGYDKSSKGNNWTLNNFSLTAGTSYDWMLDVPGNSFATLNPLVDMAGSPTLSKGNLAITGDAAWNDTIASQYFSEGKIVYEFYPYDQYALIGVCGAAYRSGQTDPHTKSGQITWHGSTGAVWVDGSATGTNLGTFNGTNRIRVEINKDANTVQFYKDNVAAGSAQSLPSSISGGSVAPICHISANGQTAHFNFGQAPLHSSATYHSGAGGYFADSPSANYKAICQRNMPDPAILNPKNGFVSVTATEDNIYSTLASARSGWTEYVDVLKNLAAAESWAYQFSHDSSNEYAVAASSLVRQTKRTQSGSNTWIGRSIRIGATYGTAAGSVSHTNGAATTVTHNVGKSARQFILLFNRAGGSAVPVYHPDLTSGELLDLCTTAADTASTAITSVGTNSFQIGSATATGTYDYLVCSEISQFFDLGVWTGNASADGVYYDAGHKADTVYAKQKTTTGDHRVYGALRPGYNVVGGVVLANTNAAETTAAEIDIDAFGIKGRTTTTPNAAEAMVTASWAQTTAKYALGR